MRENFQAIDKEGDIFKTTKLTADSGFHTEKNMEMLFTEGIDAYVADTHFRKRDPRFAGYERYKERADRKGRTPLFSTKDFIFDKELRYCLCPAGKRLYRSGANDRAYRFKGPQSACIPCELRAKCLRNPDRTGIRQVAYFTGRTGKGPTFTDRMKRKIDSTISRVLYGMRLAISEPPFAHIVSAIGLDRFTLRGKIKVNTQWNLFCIVHNVKKIHRYGFLFA